MFSERDKNTVAVTLESAEIQQHTDTYTPNALFNDQFLHAQHSQGCHICTATKDDIKTKPVTVASDFDLYLSLTAANNLNVTVDEHTKKQLSRFHIRKIVTIAQLMHYDMHCHYGQDICSKSVFCVNLGCKSNVQFLLHFSIA